MPEHYFIIKRKKKEIVESKNAPFKKNIVTGTLKEHGLCVFDFSQDGKEDMYRVESGDGNHFEVSGILIETGFEKLSVQADIAVAAGVVGPVKLENMKPNYDNGATCADIDNDGDQDILITSLNDENIIFKQVKYLKFKEYSKELNLRSDGDRSQSGIWGDVNNDGFIDLFISNSFTQNKLYLNNGSGYFNDVTKEVDTAFGKGGAMEALIEAKKAGVVRHLGVTSHSVEASLAAMARYDFDSIMVPINFACYYGGDFGRQIIEKAKAKKMAVMAIKAMIREPWPTEDHPERKMFSKSGYRPLSEPSEVELALRFTLSQPVTAILPPSDEELFWMAVDVAMKFEPLTQSQKKKVRTWGSQTEPIFSYQKEVES